MTAANTAGAAAGQETHALLGELLELAPGRKLVARRTFDARQETWLQDHTIGREVSQLTPELLALPVMPLTFSLELLAQGVAAISAGSVVVRLEDVRAHRWIAFDTGPQSLEVQVEASRDDAGRFHARLYNLSEPVIQNVGRRPVVEADVVVAAGYPAAPAADTTIAGEPSRSAPEALYRDIMFHGPSWQGVTAITGTGSAGSTASLLALPSTGFWPKGEEQPFCVDPIVLDAAGQLLGFWTAEHLTEGQMVFPFHVDTIAVFGPSLPAGTELRCDMAIQHLDAVQIRIDLNVYHGSSTLLQVRGWTDRRFYLPAAVRSIAHPPRLRDVCMPVSLDEYGTEATGWQCRALDAELPAQNAFLARVWAARILSQAERDALPDGFANRDGSLHWLAGLHACKEAVQAFLSGRGIEVSPADVTLEPATEGRFYANGVWNSSVSEVPEVVLVQGLNWSAAVAVPRGQATSTVLDRIVDDLRSRRAQMRSIETQGTWSR